MAIFDEKERGRIRCPKCYGMLFEEREIYAYVRLNEHIYEATQDKIQLVCERCGTVAHEIKMNGKNTIRR
jgi:uncharacterized C2H2 Zn-finger protein